MSLGNNLTPQEKKLEASLACFQPIGSTITRDAMMFHAGVASARKRYRYWQSSTAILGLLLCVSLLLPLFQTPQPAITPARTVDQQLALLQIPPTDLELLYRKASSLSGSSYIKLRDDILLYGIDTLPMPKQPALPDEPPLTTESLLNSMMRS